MEKHRCDFSVRAMSRVLKVSSSGFYSFLKRGPSKRAQEDEELLNELMEVYTESEERSGRPKLLKALQARGHRVGGERVRKLMKQARIKAKLKKKFRVATTDSNHSYPVSANLLRRNFHAERPNQIWVSDITYVRVKSNWVYLCTVIDLYSRKVVGWSLQKTMATELVTDAVNNALAVRKINPWELTFHSDRGSQYASYRFRDLLKEYKIKSSMSRKGDCWDNAVAESFFATIKSECIYWRSFASIQEARMEIFKYIECFYNRKRLHSYLGYVSPDNFELMKRAA